jgi:hypothetical protein
LLTTPADYIGIYSGTSATAPTSYTGYTWYKVKGEPGETTASEVGLPDNGEWGDLLRIDMDGKPYWLKGTNYYLNIHEEVIGLASPAKRTIIGHDGGGDIAIHVNGAMYQIYEDFEIIVFNSASHSKMVTVIPSGDFYFKDDRNAVELHSNNFLEILFRPIFEPDMGIFTVLITMGFKGLDY